MTLSLEGVGVLYATEARETFSDVTLHLARGWAGVVGPHGSGKSTLLRLASGTLSPTTGRVRVPGRAVYCPQDATEPPGNLEQLLQTPDGISAQLVGRLGVLPESLDSWAQLGLAQRRRAQLACALWQQPEVLALDEPTAGIDRQTRSVLAGLLAGFRGIGLLASHDRELLDRLCSSCVTLEQGRPVLRRGNYSQAHAIAARELETLRRQKQTASRDHAALSATVDARRREANQANVRRSKRYLDPRDHDARQKLDRARKTGKDAQAGRLLKQLQGRLAQAADRADSIDLIADQQLGAELCGEVTLQETLWKTPGEFLPLPGGRLMQIPQLQIRPQDRVGITGPSGTGRSSLLRHIAGNLQASGLRTAWLPQTLSAEQVRQAFHEARQLERSARELLDRALVCFGIDPAGLFSEQTSSSDDVRRLVLALGLVRQPQLIVLDEPQDGLDLLSIERLETAMAACTCALLLVTDDAPMLARLTPARWRVEGQANGSVLRVDQTPPTPAAAGPSAPATP